MHFLCFMSDINVLRNYLKNGELHSTSHWYRRLWNKFRTIYFTHIGRLAPDVFVLYLFLSFSTLFFFIMILFNPTSSYLWLNFLSSQGTEVNKNSISYTSVVSPQTKKKKKKDKKNKERVWGQTSILAESFFACWGCTESHRKHAEIRGV